MASGPMVFFEDGPWVGQVKPWIFQSTKYEIVGKGYYQLIQSGDRASWHTYDAVWHPEEDAMQGMDDEQAPVGDAGGVRSVEDGADYTLIMDGPMYDRWAAWMTLGAKKYEARNWLLFEGPEALARCERSLLRHVRKLIRGDDDEDHAAAIFFNVDAIEYIKGRQA